MKSPFTQDIVSEQVVTKYEKESSSLKPYTLHIEYSIPVYRYGTKSLVIEKRYPNFKTEVMEFDAREILALQKVLDESKRFPKSKKD